MVCFTASIIKILLGVFNFLFLILGVGITFIGFSLQKWGTENADAIDLANINVKSTGFIILGVGVVLVLISFFGFFGACCESSFMLNTYGVFMVIMIGGQIYALVYSVSHNTDIEKKIEEGIKKAIVEIHNNSKTEIILNKLQCQLKCCGWDGPNDFNSNKYPASCCGKCENNEGQFCDKVQVNDKCKDKLNFNNLHTIFGSSIGISIVIILFQLILVFAACCLAREI